jgi:STE24 endopeptidase
VLRFLARWIVFTTLMLGISTKLAAAQPPVPPVAVMRSDPYTFHLPPRAIAYRHTQRALGLVGMVWGLFGPWLFVRFGGSVWLRNAVYRLIRQPLPDENAPPKHRTLQIFYLFYTLILLFWNMPFGLAALATEWRYGFSHQSLAMYLIDAAKSWGIGLLLAPLLSGIYWLVARSPRHWWLWLWGLTLPLLIGIVIVEPDARELHNTYVPLQVGSLRTKILALATRAGAPHAVILVEDTSRRTTHVNAYVNGLGPTARIVLNDTALQTLPEDQLLAIIGHELGHYVEKHLWYGALSGAVGSGTFYLLAFCLWPYLERRTRRSKTGLRGTMDLAALPLLFLYLSVAILAQEPIANAESRYMEHRADAFGLRVTGLDTATARLMVGFAERDYSDPDPPALLHFWFGTHPTLKERIAFALSGEVKPDVTAGAHP